MRSTFIYMTLFGYKHNFLMFYSWPCLHQWLETRPTRQVCPVCKAAISKEKVIPLYGRGATKQEDPRFVMYSLMTCMFYSTSILY